MPTLYFFLPERVNTASDTVSIQLVNLQVDVRAILNLMTNQKFHVACLKGNSLIIATENKHKI